MEKFSDILERDFRWPRGGDKAFTESSNWQKNSHVKTDPHTRLVLMITGYKNAADALVDQSLHSGFERDTLVYPIVFLYRQFLELELKYIIATFGRHVQVEANWKSHDLAVLWKEFVKVLAGFNVEDPERTDTIVSSLVAEFAKVDPQSYSYRYPVDIRGKEIPLGMDRLDLGALKKAMDGLEGYFLGCDGYLDHLSGA